MKHYSVKSFSGKSWAKAASCAKNVETIIVKHDEDKLPFEIIYGENPKWSKTLHTLCKVVTLQVGGTTKENYKTVIDAIFLDYMTDHASDVYEFMKIDSRKPVRSQNYK